MVDMPRAGDIVASKYRIAKVLGRGGMGIVYEASNVSTHARVALKMLLPSSLEDGGLVERFAREARVHGRLRNPFVARVFDSDVTDEGWPFLVMELLEGRDLRKELDAHGGRVAADEAASYVLQVCAALAEAHDLRMIHRDLKPSNVFVEDHGFRLVRVLDFGISKELDIEDAQLTSTSTALGTYSYMSPEQLRAASDVDERSDVWALGVILFQAMEGRLPFTGTAAEVASKILDITRAPALESRDVPPGLAKVVARALEKEPSRRHADARALGVALAPFARPSTAVEQARGEIARSRSTNAVTRQMPAPVGALDATADDVSTIEQARADATSPTGGGVASFNVPGARSSTRPRARLAAALLMIVTVATSFGVVTWLFRARSQSGVALATTSDAPPPAVHSPAPPFSAASAAAPDLPPSTSSVVPTQPREEAPLVGSATASVAARPSRRMAMPPRGRTAPPAIATTAGPPPAQAPLDPNPPRF